MTVLIADLATAGGVRAPLAHIANEVFAGLARELEAQGVSRKVSADMFGLALRAYVRKVRRLSEAQSDAGITLWQAVLDFIARERMVPRTRVLERFRGDDPLQLTSVLRDLAQSGVVFVAGGGEDAVYRAASTAELDTMARLASDQGLDELVWVMVYRDGPFTDAQLASRLSRSPSEVSGSVERLISGGRVLRTLNSELSATEFVISRHSAGWEAAVFDHLQAVVSTIRQRLTRLASSKNSPVDEVGGSTYTFDVWPGHPLEADAKAQLEAVRTQLGALRLRVDAHNKQSGLPEEYQQVITYVGQCVLERERPQTSLEELVAGEKA